MEISGNKNWQQTKQAYPKRPYINLQATIK
jgi:hypothetical protein